MIIIIIVKYRSSFKNMITKKFENILMIVNTHLQMIQISALNNR